MKIKLWNWAIILTCTMALNACNNDNNDKECDAQTPCTDDTTCIDHQCIHTECNLRKSCIGELICNDDGNCMPQSEVFQCGKHLACKDDTNVVTLINA